MPWRILIGGIRKDKRGYTENMRNNEDIGG